MGLEGWTGSLLGCGVSSFEIFSVDSAVAGVVSAGVDLGEAVDCL
jgi:hypothetical protein